MKLYRRLPGPARPGYVRLLDRVRVEAARAAGCGFAVAVARGPRVKAVKALGFGVVRTVPSSAPGVDGREQPIEASVLVPALGPSA